MSLKPTKSSVQHITTVPYSQLLVHFVVRPAVFELQATLRKVHQTTAKWPWTLKGQMYTTYVLLVFPVPKFQSVSLYGQPFLSYRPFKMHRMTPKWPLTLHVLLMPRVSNFPPFRSWPTFSSYRPFETSAPNDPKMILNTTRSKVHRTCGISIPRDPNISPFCSTTSRFQDIAHLSSINDYHAKRPKIEQKILLLPLPGLL